MAGRIWSDGTYDWVWLQPISRYCKQAERSKMAGGIENPEQVELRVDLVCGVVGEVGRRAGWSVSEAILTENNHKLPKGS